MEKTQKEIMELDEYIKNHSALIGQCLKMKSRVGGIKFGVKEERERVLMIVYRIRDKYNKGRMMDVDDFVVELEKQIKRENKLQERIKKLESIVDKGDYSSNKTSLEMLEATSELRGIYFSLIESLKIIKKCDFDKDNIAIKEFKEVIEKKIKNET